MQVQTVALICPACGKSLQVPAELKTFSCLYCGAKHRTADLLAPASAADDADRAFAQAHLLDCIRNYPDCYKQFTRKRYADSFQTHLDGTRETWEALDRWVCAHPTRRTELLTEFAQRFLTQWEAYHQAHPKARTKRARERLEFADKLTLAWYTIPAIRQLELCTGEEFCRILCEAFVERYPNNPFSLGSYETLSTGFRRRGLFRR